MATFDYIIVGAGSAGGSGSSFAAVVGPASSGAVKTRCEFGTPLPIHTAFRIRTPSAFSGGFTLIEMMITLVVLAILVAVAVPSYRNYVLKANRAVAKGNLRLVVDHQFVVLDGLAQGGRRATGGKDAKAMAAQTAREIVEALLV